MITITITDNDTSSATWAHQHYISKLQRTECGRYLRAARLNPAALREAEAGAVLDATTKPSKISLLASNPAEAGVG